MLSLLRIVHTLSVALWFGAVVFFTLAGLLIFQAFAEVSKLPPQDPQRSWLPLPRALAQPAPEGFRDPLSLEQGSRAAGVAVSRIFPVYYALQTLCGFFACVTALLLARSGTGGGHRLRAWLCWAAFVSVLGGWWLEMRVRDLRTPRNELTDRALSRTPPNSEALEEALGARKTFERWHTYSLIQNFATLLFVFGVTVLLPSLSAPGTPREG